MYMKYNLYLITILLNNNHFYIHLTRVNSNTGIIIVFLRRFAKNNFKILNSILQVLNIENTMKKYRLHHITKSVISKVSSK